MTDRLIYPLNGDSAATNQTLPYCTDQGFFSAIGIMISPLDIMSNYSVSHDLVIILLDMMPVG